MNILRLSIVATMILTMTAVDASPYRFGKNGRRVKVHPPAKAAVHAAPSHNRQSGPVVQLRPQPHVETLPATALNRPAASISGTGVSYSEPKLTPSQETELRWRLYSYP